MVTQGPKVMKFFHQETCWLLQQRERQLEGPILALPCVGSEEAHVPAAHSLFVMVLPHYKSG